MMELNFKSGMRCIARAVLVLGVTAIAAIVQAAGSCSVSSGGMVFGTYQPITFAGKLNSVAASSTATVSLVCTGITIGSYTIGLGPSFDGPGDRMSVRYLHNSTGVDGLVAFNAFIDPGYSLIWGDGIRGVLLRGVMPPGGSNRTHTVYGRVPEGQTLLKAGTYSSAMTITISYDP